METPPIHTLPDEVLALIFSRLSQEEIITSVLPVCQRWQTVAQSEVLSRGLAFCYFDDDDDDDDAVPSEEALRLIRAIPNLKSLELRDRPDAVKLLEAVGSRCRKLQRLIVEGWRNEDSALPAALLAVFRSCSEHLAELTLKRIDVASPIDFCLELGTALPNLRQLTLLWSWRDPAALDAVMDSCPQMQEFCTDCPFSDTQIGRLVQHWSSSLQVLELTASELSDAGVAALAGCSQLRSLQLVCRASYAAGLEQLASLAQLEELNLFYFKSLQPENIRQFFSQSRSAGRLRNIHLSRCAGVDDGVLTALAAACPSVEDVCVCGSERVTAAGVRALLRGCRRLLRLNVSGTDDSVAQVLPEIPQLAPQLRRLNIVGLFFSLDVVRSVEAQMPALKIIKLYP